MDKKIKPPIFIVGPPRSGTTLTAKILGKHSHIFMPGETHFFDDVYSRQKELGSPQNPDSFIKIKDRLSTLYDRYFEPDDQKRIDLLFSDSEILSQMKVSCSDYRNILSFFMEIQMKHEGKSRWGNNAPRDIFYVNDILSFYPDAKFIICVRDVRDFLVSYRDKWKITSGVHIERLKKLYHPIISSLLWKSSMKNIPFIKSIVPQDNMIIIRYEDMVQNAEKVVTEICKVIDEKYETEMLQIDSHNSSSTVTETGIFSSSIGRWREKLPEEDVYLAQLLTKKELNSLEYSIEKVKVTPLKLLKIITSFPFALRSALKANKKFRGPLVPYLLRRLQSLISK